MQKKLSYGLLKWGLLFAAASTLATACTISNDPNLDISDEGGESGSTNTSGKNAGGTSSGGSSAGTTNGGKSGSAGSGGSSAGTAGSGMAGMGGDNSSYVPGACETDNVTSKTVPSCAPAASDMDNACLVCLKAQCCENWQQCYGEEPTSACGWGTTEDAPGQFDCVVACVVKNGADELDNTKNFEKCADECLNQCADKDMGLIRQDTNDLLDCANRKCIADCFPPP